MLVADLVRLPRDVPLAHVQELLGRIGRDRINDVIIPHDYNDATALQWAIGTQRLDIIRAVVDTGANVNYQDSEHHIYHPLTQCVMINVPLMQGMYQTHNKKFLLYLFTLMKICDDKFKKFANCLYKLVEIFRLL